MKLSPAERMLNRDIKLAACPEVVSRQPTPPSSAASFSSTYAPVGLEMREYICPGAVRSNSLPICSVESYVYVVLW